MTRISTASRGFVSHSWAFLFDDADDDDDDDEMIGA